MPPSLRRELLAAVAMSTKKRKSKKKEAISSRLPGTCTKKMMIPEAGLLPGEAGFSFLFDECIEGCWAIEPVINRHPAVKVLLNNCASGDPAAIQSALPDAVKDTRQLCTLHHRDPDAAEKLMRYTALMLAVHSGRSGAVRVLLDEKTSPVCVYLDKHQEACCPFTPLIGAAGSGYACIVELLLEHNASTQPVAPNSWTALHFSCFEGHVSAVEALVRAGCDIGVRDSKGRTGQQLAQKTGRGQPLTLVQQKGCAAVVELLRAADAKERASLVTMSRRGDCDAMKALLDAGADIEKMEPYMPRRKQKTTTPMAPALFVAALKGHEQATALLLERKADPDIGNQNRMTALMAAAAMGSTSVVKLLLEHNASIDRPCAAIDASIGDALAVDSAATAFHVACIHGFLGAVEALVRAGCDTSLPMCVSNGIPITVRQLIEGSTNEPNEGHAQVLKLLDALDAEMLVKAATENDCTALTQLLDRGADINALSPAVLEDTCRRDAGVNVTPLIAALLCEHELAMQLLLARGADPDAFDSDALSNAYIFCALAIAANGFGATFKDNSAVKLLLKHGAAVHGNDCLYLACKSGQVEAVECFVRAGCDTSEPVADVKIFRNTPFLSQHIGQTGREIAEQCGHTAVLAVLDAREAEAQAKAEAKAAKKRAQNKKKAQRRKEVKKQAAAAAAATEAAAAAAAVAAAVAAAEAEATVPSAAA